MIRLILNFPHDKLGFPIRDTEETQYASFDGVFERLSVPDYSSYTIIGVRHEPSPKMPVVRVPTGHVQLCSQHRLASDILS